MTKAWWQKQLRVPIMIHENFWALEVLLTCVGDPTPGVSLGTLKTEPHREWDQVCLLAWDGVWPLWITFVKVFLCCSFLETENSLGHLPFTSWKLSKMGSCPEAPALRFIPFCRRLLLNLISFSTSLGSNINSCLFFSSNGTCCVSFWPTCSFSL